MFYVPKIGHSSLLTSYLFFFILVILSINFPITKQNIFQPLIVDHIVSKQIKFQAFNKIFGVRNINYNRLPENI